MNPLESYVTVQERIKLFVTAYPEGSLQLVNVEWQMVGDQMILVGTAHAYRFPDDQRPGIGTAQEYIPGKTSFTKGSEIQNLETSAWGRAIAALGIGIDKAVASQDEVQRAMSLPDERPAKTVKRANPKLKELASAMADAGIPKEGMLSTVVMIIERDVQSSAELTDEEIDQVLAVLNDAA